MKHFVVINRWATQDDLGVNIVGIAHDIANAKEIFAKMLLGA